MLGAEKKKPSIDLAVVLGGGKGKVKPPAMSMDDDGEGADEGTGAGGESEDALPPGFAEAGEEFLDDSKPTEERLAALHRAIKACGESY